MSAELKPCAVANCQGEAFPAFGTHLCLQHVTDANRMLNTGNVQGWQSRCAAVAKWVPR